MRGRGPDAPSRGVPGVPAAGSDARSAAPGTRASAPPGRVRGPGPVRRVLVAAAAVAGLALACGGGSDGGSSPEEGGPGRGRQDDGITPAVEVVEAREGRLPRSERLTGTVRAGGQVVISPEVSGPVVEVRVQTGDRVQEGDALVRIRSETGRSQLQQARANLENTRAQAERARAQLEEMEAQFERTRALAEDSLVSREALQTQRTALESARADFQQAQARVEEAEATVEERREAVEQAVVRAPITGHVGNRDVEVGMRVDPQTQLFTIGRLEDMKVEVAVPQEILPQLEPGQEVEIRAESLPDTVLRAEISRVSPFLSEGTFSARAEIDVSNHRGLLMPGQFVTVDVYYGETASATLVPKSALYDDPATGRRGIWIAALDDADAEPVSGDEAGTLVGPVDVRFRPVEVQAEGRHHAGVRDLEPGAWVVVLGQHLLSREDGDGAARARVRPLGWERIEGLQRIQREDLLRQFMARQQRLARTRLDSAEEAAEPDTVGGPPM